MDEEQLKRVVEAALLAAGNPLTLDKLVELFTVKGVELDKAAVRGALDRLTADYGERGIELKEVASGYRIQVKSSMQDWLQPLWEERAPRYTRALLETLALIAYRQPITRAEIEEVRGVAVSSTIVRTLMERGWVRVVGYRDVPGKPSMLGTTREFLDYFGLKRLEDLPPLADIKDGFPEMSPQSDFLDSLEAAEHGNVRLAVDGVPEAAVSFDDEPNEDDRPAALEAPADTVHEAGQDDDGPEPVEDVDTAAAQGELESDSELDAEPEPEPAVTSDLEEASEGEPEDDSEDVLPRAQNESN
jgi:segregation and condensation protein B